MKTVKAILILEIVTFSSRITSHSVAAPDESDFDFDIEPIIR